MTKGIMTAIAIVGAVALATSAMAASNMNASRSNVYRAINVSDQNAVAACKKDGGTVAKDLQGKDTCITCSPGEKMTANGCSK